VTYSVKAGLKKLQSLPGLSTGEMCMILWSLILTLPVCHGVSNMPPIA